VPATAAAAAGPASRSPAGRSDGRRRVCSHVYGGCLDQAPICPWRRL